MPGDRALRYVRFFFLFFHLIFFPCLSCFVCWLMAFPTQGHVGSLEPGRRITSKRKLGRHCEDLERQDREVWLDVERAQVPAKPLMQSKLSKLSVRSINFLSNFAVKTTRIVPAPLVNIVVGRRSIPCARWPDTLIGEIKKKNSNFLTLPELLRVLTNLIAIAVSGPWRGLQTAQK